MYVCVWSDCSWLVAWRNLRVVLLRSLFLSQVWKKSIFPQNCKAKSATESLDWRLSQHYYSYHYCYGNITSIGYVYTREVFPKSRHQESGGYRVGCNSLETRNSSLLLTGIVRYESMKGFSLGLLKSLRWEMACSHWPKRSKLTGRLPELSASPIAIIAFLLNHFLLIFQEDEVYISH